MIPKTGAQIGAKPRPEFAQTQPDTLTGGLIAYAQVRGVAGIIAIGDDVLEIPRLCQKAIEQVILMERLAEPDEVTVKPDRESEQRVRQMADFKIIASRLFCRTRVMDIAEDTEGAARHGENQP
jgi:hypothetical protein